MSFVTSEIRTQVRYTFLQKNCQTFISGKGIDDFKIDQLICLQRQCGHIS
jgi:hypothetical protein